MLVQTGNTRKVMKMFYTFRQNNSYGHFDVDENVAHYVVIQAYNADEANTKAEGIGIYFYGCHAGIDCHCCGDRWVSVDDSDANDQPVLYGENVAAYIDDNGRDTCIIHYANGSRETSKIDIFKPEKARRAIA